MMIIVMVMVYYISLLVGPSALHLKSGDGSLRVHQAVFVFVLKNARFLYVVIGGYDLVHVNLLELVWVLRVLYLSQEVDSVSDLLLSELFNKEVTLDISDATALVLLAVLVLKVEASVDEVSYAAFGHLRPMLLLILLFLNRVEVAYVGSQAFETRGWRKEGHLLIYRRGI